MAHEPLSFACPRCATASSAAFYGPCATCRDELRTQMRAVARAVDAAYEPKMNVTPNAVALKD